MWRDWYTHDVVNGSVGTPTTLAAPLGHINVHVRDGAVLLLHAQPGYTTTETRAGPFSLLVTLSPDGNAFGSAYLDDGETLPPTPSRTLDFHAAAGALHIVSAGTYSVGPKLQNITVLGTPKPVRVQVDGKTVESWEYLSAQEKLVVGSLALDLNGGATISWE